MTTTIYQTSLAAHVVATQGTRLKGLNSAERYEAIEALTHDMTEDELRTLARVAMTVITCEVGAEALERLDAIAVHAALFGKEGR